MEQLKIQLAAAEKKLEAELPKHASNEGNLPSGSLPDGDGKLSPTLEKSVGDEQPAKRSKAA